MTVIQRLELLAEDVKNLESGGGGGDLSAYLTKEEASSTYETQSAATTSLALKADKSTTYTKTEVDEAIAGAAGGDVVVSGDNVKTKNAGLGKGILIGNQAGFNSLATDNSQIAIGVRAGITQPSGGAHPIAIGYQASGKTDDLVIGNLVINNGTGIHNTLIGSYANANGNVGFNVALGYQARTGGDTVSVGYNTGGTHSSGTYIGTSCRPASDADTSYGQLAVGYLSRVSGNFSTAIGYFLNANTGQVVLGRNNEAVNSQDCFIVGNGTDETNPSNLIEITTPFKVSTAGIEVNGTPYGQTATSTATLPSAGTGSTFDTGIEWTYIQAKNDFILDSEGFQAKFRYGFTKGSYIHYFGYILQNSTTKIAHLELGAPTGSGTTALATWISSGAIPTT